MGKHKRSAVGGLEHLLATGWDVAAVVAPPPDGRALPEQRLDRAAALGRAGCLNFHPAPLPDMRGIGGYNVAILEDWAEWGVSAHFVDEQLDTGDLVRVDRFPIDRARETALSLDLRSQERLLELFRWTADRLAAGEELPREPQGEGRYVTREEFESLRAVAPDDDPELTARRIRAFWYPPHDGATIEVGGETLTLVDRDLLGHVADVTLRAGLVP
jgi:methionyl-tRNA formyltransferase